MAATSVKKSAKKKQLAPRKSTAIANIQKQLADEAAGISDSVGAPSTNAISTRDKVFTLPDGSIIQDSMEVVIVDFNSQNKFYPGKWDPKNIVPPECFAINKVPKSLAPSENSPDMQVKKGQLCEDCPMNQFGSDGDGKACNNTRVLAVLPVDAEPDDEIMTISVSATALKGYDGYVQQVAKLFGVPPIGVITTISFHPEKSFPSLLFGNPQANERVAEFFARRPETEVLLNAEPDVSSATPAKPKRRGARK